MVIFVTYIYIITEVGYWDTNIHITEVLGLKFLVRINTDVYGSNRRKKKVNHLLKVTWSFK